MSIETHFYLVDCNDADFKKLESATPEEIEEWEDDNGPIPEFPGKRIRSKNGCVEETNAEYGGWVIDLSKIPKNATHICITRG